MTTITVSITNLSALTLANLHFATRITTGKEEKNVKECLRNSSEKDLT